MRRRKQWLEIALKATIGIGAFGLLAVPLRGFLVESAGWAQGLLAGGWQGISREVRSVWDCRDLAKDQNLRLEELQADLRQLRFAYQNLRAQQLPPELKTFPEALRGKVISRAPSSWNRELTINLGSRDGAQEGLLAVTTEGALGKLLRVERNHAVVRLLSSSRLHLGARVHPSGTVGILSGNGPGRAKLRFVPIGSPVHVGDRVDIASFSPNGLQTLLPSSYPAGRITAVSPSSNQDELDVSVRLFEDGSDVTQVLVLQADER